MATAKKTTAAPANSAKAAPVKTTAAPANSAKAAPVKTPVAKAAPAAKVRLHKRGDAVSVTRRNGQVVTGKVTGVVDRPNGRWITVNTSTDKKKEALITARAGQVKFA